MTCPIHDTYTDNNTKCVYCEVAKLRAELEVHIQLNAKLKQELEQVKKVRDAYKKAKQENDERFMIERDEARLELAIERSNFKEYKEYIKRNFPLVWSRADDAMSLRGINEP